MKYFIWIGFVGCLAVACGSNRNEPNDQKTDNDTAKVGAPESVQAEETASSCAADADCVPATCCHPSACIHKDNAPKNCGEMMCTAECKDGTMDCGKGSCGCNAGACVVNWAN